jgi:hypothetical protein
MRVAYKELMEVLGVGYLLGSYETCPWSAYDEDKAITCSAEVRADPDGETIEAEIQMMPDEPPAGKPPMEQMCLITAKKVSAAGEWEVKDLKIKGEPFDEEIYNWQEKCCNFFRAAIVELQRDIVPDIDDLIERELNIKEKQGDQRGSGGGKSPKIRAAQLLDMKQKGGF